jgi:hypothetical protein
MNSDIVRQQIPLRYVKIGFSMVNIGDPKNKHAVLESCSNQVNPQTVGLMEAFGYNDTCLFIDLWNKE